MMAEREMNMAWWNDYSAIPFTDHGRDETGCDCYGLLRLVYRDRLQVELPLLLDGYRHTEQRQILANLIQGSAMLIGFKPVALDDLQPLNVLIIRQAGADCHLGLLVSPSLMLHTEAGRGVVVEDIRRPHLKPRIREAYRYDH